MSKFIISGVRFVESETMSIVGEIKAKLLRDPTRPNPRFLNGDFHFNKNGKCYDARNVDLVSVGNILYQCMVGTEGTLSNMDDIAMIHEIVEKKYWRFQRDGQPLYLSGYNTFRLIKSDSFQFLKQMLSVNVNSWILMQSAFLKSFYDQYAIELNALYLDSVRFQTDLSQMTDYIISPPPKCTIFGLF